MPDPMPLPQQCSAVAIVCDNCSRQLQALSQGLIRVDLESERPLLTNTARNAAKLARDSLTVLLGNLGTEPKKAKARKL